MSTARFRAIVRSLHSAERHAPAPHVPSRPPAAARIRAGPARRLEAARGAGAARPARQHLHQNRKLGGRAMRRFTVRLQAVGRHRRVMACDSVPRRLGTSGARLLGHLCAARLSLFAKIPESPCAAAQCSRSHRPATRRQLADSVSDAGTLRHAATGSTQVMGARQARLPAGQPVAAATGRPLYANGRDACHAQVILPLNTRGWGDQRECSQRVRWP